MGEIINWMGGWPKEGLLSAAEWEDLLADRSDAIHYMATEQEKAYGIGSLRENLSSGLLQGLVGGDAGRLAVFAGADAALQGAIQLLLQPGDAVLVERPTSRSALQAFRRAGATLVAAPADADGMDPEALALALKRYRPRVVYTAPSCTDPEGRCWSRERRRALAEQCASAGSALIIDERQSLLLEAGDRWSAELEAGGETITIGEIPPGLYGGGRIGWMTVSGAGAADTLRVLGERRTADHALAPFRDQAALASLLEGEAFHPMLATLRFICRARNGYLAEMLRKQAWPDVVWNEAREGLHTWLALPDGLDGEAVLRAAWLKGVLFQPGVGFYATEQDRFKLRVTVVHSDEAEIREGVRRLGEAIGEFTART